MTYNHNNLFLDALDTDKVNEIEEIKLNKLFALKLINDLDRVFQTNYEILDDQNSVTIRMKRSVSNNWIRAFSFIATKNGISFNATILDYYSRVGGLYEKYKSNEGTKAEDNFLREGTTQFGNVTFRILINRNSDNLKEILRDIVFIMEREQYRKRF